MVNKIFLTLFSLILICHPANSQEVQFEEQAELILYVDKAMIITKFYEDTVKSGLKMDEVKKKLSLNGIKFLIKKLPWARVSRDTKNKNNYLIYGVSKTEQRKLQFNWIVSLHEGTGMKVSLYSTDDIRQLNLSKQDMVNSKYKAICKVGTAACSYLKEFGFKTDQINMLPYSTNSAILEQMIIRKRAHFFVGIQTVVENNLKALNLPINSVSPVFEISSVGLYIAGTKDMDENLLNRVNVALN